MVVSKILMSESQFQNFNHLKIHSQYSICEGAVKIDDLKDFSKFNKIKSLGLCDTTNLCGALEFAEKISKVGSQPIIGTQINFKYGDTTGMLPLFALDEEGYKRIIKLSSFSFLDNDELSEPHLNFDELLEDTHGVAIFSGTVFGLFGQLFDKGKFSEILDLYTKLKTSFNDRFYLEIQRHNDQNEIGFEKFNLNKSLELEIPIIATNEIFYLNKEGKVAGFKQWKAIDSVNFGRAVGGKYFGKKPGEYTGRPFQFSNRNETEMLETMVGHYNKMDIKAVSSYFADQVTINGYDGKQVKLSNKELAGLFDTYKSVTWTPYSIVPIKIANTDAASGVMMFSNERRVLKSGRIWEKELMETFYFDLDGKISSVTQFAR